jgi:hypothetical protein
MYNKSEKTKFTFILERSNYKRMLFVVFCSVCCFEFLWILTYFGFKLSWNAKMHLEYTVRIVNLIHDVVVSALSTYTLFFCDLSELTDIEANLTDPAQFKSSWLVELLVGITLGYMLVEMSNILIAVRLSPLIRKDLEESDVQWFRFHCAIFTAFVVCTWTKTGLLALIWGIWGEVYAILEIVSDFQRIEQWILSSPIRQFAVSFLKACVLFFNRILPIAYLVFLSIFKSSSATRFWNQGFAAIPNLAFFIQVTLLSLIGLYNFDSFLTECKWCKQFYTKTQITKEKAK